MQGQSGTCSDTDRSRAGGERSDAPSLGLKSQTVSPAKASGTPEGQRQTSLVFCISVVMVLLGYPNSA